jgi:hypothetical protein
LVLWIAVSLQLPFMLGIPHPTGYPLYLILGYLVTHLPFGQSVIYRLIFSAVTSAAAVVIFIMRHNLSGEF